MHLHTNGFRSSLSNCTTGICISSSVIYVANLPMVVFIGAMHLSALSPRHACLTVETTLLNEFANRMENKFIMWNASRFIRTGAELQPQIPTKPICTTGISEHINSCNGCNRSTLFICSLHLNETKLTNSWYDLNLWKYTRFSYIVADVLLCMFRGISVK